MPWCPNCQKEFEEELTICPECNGELEESEDEMKLVNPLRRNQNPRAFVEASARADDMKSTGTAFFVVGFLLIVVAVLIYLGFIPFGNPETSKILNSGIIVIFSACFFAVAIYSHKRANLLNSKSTQEEKLTEEIIQYCVDNYVEPEIDNLDTIEYPEEERYFYREKFLRDMISKEFKGLDESYVDYILDIIYTELFDQEKKEEI